MRTLGVILVALAILGFETGLALRSAGILRRLPATLAALVALLALGLVLIAL